MNLSALERRILPWCDPLAVARRLKDRPGAIALLSDGGSLGRWSFVAADPDQIHVGGLDEGLQLLRQPDWVRQTVGLMAYDAGARPATGPRPAVWPDLILARYPAMLAFDHAGQEVIAIGRGPGRPAAVVAADRAEGWLEAAVSPTAPPPPPAASFDADAPSDAYTAAVADVVQRIAAGELFQANVARSWSGSLRRQGEPFDVVLRLAGRASAYGAYWRLGDRALVSNSPELFLTFDPTTGRIETRPIKGTRPRHADPALDAALAEGLASSAKDRAENLMIVDLMRNDLSRVATPGSVRVERLFEVERLPTVHHLVSTVSARARPGVGAADILQATFPPGSITGAPKHQAMKVIASHEPPRGPWCGSLFHLEDGRMTASVLIRTAAFERVGDLWRFRTLAGAGIVADSDPAAELAETDSKIRALREALVGS